MENGLKKMIANYHHQFKNMEKIGMYWKDFLKIKQINKLDKDT